jgi:hypothetical protein
VFGIIGDGFEPKIFLAAPGMSRVGITALRPRLEEGARIGRAGVGVELKWLWELPG